MARVVALAGQVGGAKLADGLARLRGAELAVIVNTGDDFEHLGLHFAPDLDTVLYVLGGVANPEAPWEPQGESYAVYDMVRRLGGPERLRFGDRALAAPLLRTAWKAADRRLTQITADLCRRFGIAAQVLPMSDDAVRTHVLTDDGAVPFFEYLIDLGCEPPVRGFEYAGAEFGASHPRSPTRSTHRTWRRW
ncbi:MAG: 2-phospho-L-lactate transferase CofD family protein [Burkholderiales bacterium]|nr:2-phospho-L-lactate transferase CofD family protein [Burkholderiales bacterium]